MQGFVENLSSITTLTEALDSILSQLNPFHSPTRLFTLILSVIYVNRNTFLTYQCMLHTMPISSSMISSPYKYFAQSTIHEAPHFEFSPALFYFLSYRPTYSAQQFSSQTPSIYVNLLMWMTDF
jgi:hypothetical protein